MLLRPDNAPWGRGPGEKLNTLGKFRFWDPEPRFVDENFSKFNGERAVLVAAQPLDIHDERVIALRITMRTANFPITTAVSFEVGIGSCAWPFPVDGKERPLLAEFKPIPGGIEGRPATRLMAFRRNTIASAGQ